MALGPIHPVTFGGAVSVVIPAGAQLLSDPVDMRVAPFEDLAVSVYLPDRTGPPTIHFDAQQLNWVSTKAVTTPRTRDAGAFTDSTLSWYYVSGLVVRSADMAGTVVAFGDSITDGVGSTVGADARWPNDLARRLDALGGPALSVADEGIGGNRLLGGVGLLRRQRRGQVRPGRPGPARRPGRHRARGDQRHRDRHGPPGPGEGSARTGSSPRTSG